MHTVADEIARGGVAKDHIIYLDLEKKGLKSIKTPEQLEAAVDARLPEDGGRSSGTTRRTATLSSLKTSKVRSSLRLREFSIRAIKP